MRRATVLYLPSFAKGQGPDAWDFLDVRIYSGRCEIRSGNDRRDPD
jgi:hypothetical protein